MRGRNSRKFCWRRHIHQWIRKFCYNLSGIFLSANSFSHKRGCSLPLVHCFTHHSGGLIGQNLLVFRVLLSWFPAAQGVGVLQPVFNVSTTAKDLHIYLPPPYWLPLPATHTRAAVSFISPQPCAVAPRFRARNRPTRDETNPAVRAPELRAASLVPPERRGAPPTPLPRRRRRATRT